FEDDEVERSGRALREILGGGQVASGAGRAGIGLGGRGLDGGRMCRGSGEQEGLRGEAGERRGVERAGERASIAEEGGVDAGGVADLADCALNGGSADDVAEEGAVFRSAKVERAQGAGVEGAAVDEVMLAGRGEQGGEAL